MSGRAPLPRADRPHDATGALAIGTASLRGLPLAFWILLLYLFVSSAALDEEWASVQRLRPRLVLGALALLVAGGRLVGASLTPTGRRARLPVLAVAWGAFLVATLASALWAYQPGLAKDLLVDERLPALLLFPLLVLLVRTRREFVLVVLVLAAATGFLLLRSLQEFAAGKYVVAMGVKRMVGAGTSYADPNSFAATVVFALPLVAWVGAWARRRWLRLAAGAYALLAVLAVVLTRSRAGLVLVALAAAGALALLPTRRARLVGLVLLAAAGAGALVGLPETAARRYLGWITGTQTRSEQESTEGRLRGYAVAAEMLAQRPLLGVGPGCWSAWRVAKVDGSRLMPHSLAGELLGTQGVLGTAAFAAFLAAAFGLALRERRRSREAATAALRAQRSFLGAMAVVLVLLLVSGLAAHNLGRPWWHAAPALMLVAVRVGSTDEEPGPRG